MTTLILGGTSKVGLGIAKRLLTAERPVIVAGRSPAKIPSQYKNVLFEWNDPSTYDNAFKHASPPIENVYFLAPPGLFDCLPVVKPFIDFAIDKGVKYFVMMGSSGVNKGEPHVGEIYAYLAERGVGHYVLRPTWFIDNLFTMQSYNILNFGAIISCSPNARVPYVSTEDIAEVGFQAIINKPEETEKIIIGPELLTSDTLAGLVTPFVGKKVVHKAVAPEEKLKFYLSFGIPQDHSEYLVKIEGDADAGVDASLVNRPGVYVGKVKVIDALERKADFWAAASA